MLIKYDNIDITYSNLACYNITGIGNNITLTYKAKDLETYSDSSKQIYERYYYNDKHLRVKKEILDSNGNVTSTITYTYDNNDNLIYQKQGNISLTFLYDNSNMLYGFIYNGYTYYYIRNILNDILGIVDIQGNKIVEYRYLDAWGNHSVFSRKVIHRSSISDSIIDGTIENVPNTDPSFIGNINPFRYKGYYYDKETGLFYCNSRYYNPEWGRWISPDSIEYLDPSSINGLNLYVYCNNDPINMVDPNGHAPKWWQSILIGLGVIAIAALATAAIVCSGGSATPFLAVAGQAALGGLKIATIAGATAGIVRAGKTAIEGGDIGDVGKSLVLGFSDGFLVGSVYAAGSMLLGAVSFRISGLVNNGYGWSSGNYTGGYQTPKTPGISLITHLGGINGGRSFGLDLDIYHGVHFHTNKFGIGKRSKWIKAHHWMFAPIGIGIGVGLSDGWSEW